jgi:outer membrane protein assembly factor BamB
MNSLATPTPVTDGKAVYVYYSSFGLAAYTFDGRELWKKPLPLPKTFFNQGTSTSPILANGKLVLFVQDGNRSHLLALNPADGAQLWQTPLPRFNNSFSTPVSWTEGNQSYVGLTCAQRFTAFSLTDGKEAWWINDLGFQVCATPVVKGDRLILTTAGVQGELSNMTPIPEFSEMIKKYDRNSDGLIAFDEIPEDLLFTNRQTTKGEGNMPVRQAFGMFGGIKSGEQLDQAKWEGVRNRVNGFRTGSMNSTVVLCARTGGKEDATASQVVWKETRGVPEVPSPLIWQDRVYLIRSGGLLVCRDLQTGKLIYENRLGALGGYFASPTLVDGRIYVASDRGTVTVIKAGDAFEVLARNDFEEPIFASPVVVDGVLLLRTTERLYALGEPSR